ncbi:hypothetical protein E3N88_17304 [Mikania micrantha]|uniref:Uncharacterized protein n=1 Tax=Mikania micrantha TaxID=192012 RepID=A0A5N6NU81_9ASTR|nr:hypothetical protein E3N88_17304 [Mikania micrantha]
MSLSYWLKVVKEPSFSLTVENDTWDPPAKHVLPNGNPTFWNELKKENMEFFESYSRSFSQRSNGSDRMSESETSQLIQKMISDHQADGSDSDNK